jgi:hypothetical protein
MADAPTVGELLKAEAITDEQVNALVHSVLAGRPDERARLGEEYRVDVAAAVKASAFATAVLRDKTSKLGVKRNAVRTAILLARARKACLPRALSVEVGEGSAKESALKQEPATRPDNTMICSVPTLNSDNLSQFLQKYPHDSGGFTSSKQGFLMPPNSITKTIRRQGTQQCPFVGVSKKSLEHKLHSAALQPHVREIIKRELALRARIINQS